MIEEIEAEKPTEQEPGKESPAPLCSPGAGMVEETIRLDREPTQSELVRALQGSLPPIFDYFEEKLVEQDGQILDIRITAKGGRLSLEYGVGPIIEANDKDQARHE